MSLFSLMVSAQNIEKYVTQLDSLKAAYENWHYEGTDTLDNPYLWRLYTIPETVLQESKLSGDSAVDERLQAVQGALQYVYSRQPWLVQGQKKLEEVVQDDNKVKKVKPDLSSVVESEAPVFIDPMAINIIVHRPKFWTLKGAFTMQFIQTYVSENWYKGGESNYSMLAQLIFEANYDNKRRITFDNKLEARLGFQTTKTGRHSFRNNNDLLRLTNKFGVKAARHWSYALSLQSWTQMCKSYENGDGDVHADFMSPFESVLSLGMNYKLEKQNYKLELLLNPVSADFKYVSRDALATTHGIEEGKNHRWSFGPNLTANFSWAICKNVSYSTRLYFFTSFHRTLAEWENTITLKVNKFLSTKLFLYPRFDDGAQRVNDCSYFQFFEQLSVGLDVSF